MPGNLKLNPTLVVKAFFLAPMDDGGVRRTQFVLVEHPEVAAWLVSFLDYFLYKQGKLPEERAIAMPPGGETLRALIDGGVVLTGQHPGGGPALRLNPRMEVGLWLYARRRGQPAVDAPVALGADTDLSRWLLGYGLAGGSPPEDPPLTPTLVAGLSRWAVLVEDLPAGPACLPDPAVAGDLFTELAPMARVHCQAEGEPIPAEARAILGRKSPALPPGKALVWGEDAGTGLVFPALWPAGVGREDILRKAGTAAPQRTAQWQQQRDEQRQSLARNQYAVLREILPAAQREQFRHFVRELFARGYFPPPGDGQVERRSAIHNEPTIGSIHHGLAAIVSDICAAPVKDSYCYLGCYEEGSVLERHKDRPQCVYNLSVVLDMQGRDGEPPPWPIYLEIEGRAEAVLLDVGDGLLYSGTDVWHWRDALPAGQRAIVCFYHFVPADFGGSLD
jgi:hypothetical protein